jgi:uncharacterized membrane-anchored protein YjiN (DUF445 family)
MSRAPALIVRQVNGRPARRMRIVATGLLVVMAGVFLASRHLESVHPAWGFVRAFAEAAMVGGLADWFAVTALFRHPLGVPIPHTAIIPRNKDRIGDTLATFLKDNFLIPGVVARRMRQVDVAGAAGRFLANPSEAEGRTRETASRIVADLMEALDPERLGGMIKGVIDSRLRSADLAPMLGQGLNAAIAKDRHLPLIDGMIRWAGKTLEANEHLIRQMVHDRAGSILRWTGLDATIADKIIDGLMRLIDDMSVDPGHPVRLKAEDALARLAEDLKFDTVMQHRVAEWRDEVLDNEAMRQWLDGLWEQGRAALLRAARDPRSAMGGRFGETLRQLGETLQHDPKLRATINRFTRRAAVGFSARYGESIVKLVSDTVRGWDTRTITTRLEDAVGRDLQYIRVNGTIVGGLVGLTIHAVEVWL